MTDDPPQPDPAPKQPDPQSRDPGDPNPLHALFRAFKLFLPPFLFSWALAYIGGERGVEWLYFAGLGGVTLSMVVLLMWLIS
jgi:hypothetical protein